jgi:hypothetical protein
MRSGVCLDGAEIHVNTRRRKDRVNDENSLMATIEKLTYASLLVLHPRMEPKDDTGLCFTFFTWTMLSSINYESIKPKALKLLGTIRRE